MFFERIRAEKQQKENKAMWEEWINKEGKKEIKKEEKSEVRSQEEEEELSGNLTKLLSKK